MSTRNPLFAATAGMSFLALLSASAAVGQPQNTAQQKCINKLNKDGAGVAKAQGKENATCVKKAGKNQLTGTAQACLTADTKLKVQGKKDKTVADQAAFCGTTPNYGYTSAPTVNAAAVDGQLDLVADVFGANLDAAVIDCGTSSAGCKCQSKIIKDVEKLAKTKLGIFVKCKKQALKAGATSVAALAACVTGPDPNSISADAKGKILKDLNKINADIGAECDTPGVTGTAFPGSCTSLSGTALRDCLDARVECRVCQTINEMDGLFINCDLFDDGLANASCASGVGPTPTPTDTVAPMPTMTPTVTPTPTPTFTLPPGVEFKGALLKTTGRFTYNAMVGISGANTACDSIFPTTHACSFPELQIAEAAGDLVGAKDIGNNTITSFWAIDSTHSPLVQCHVTVAWDYQTAHTGHQAEVATLNNGTGDLGPVNTGLFCLNQHWVGCCL